MRQFLLLFAACLFMISCNKDEPKPTDNGNLVSTYVNKVKREYMLFAPSDNSESPSSLLLFLHGNGGTMEEYATLCNAQQMADRENILVAIPQALDEQDQEIKGLVAVLVAMGMEIPGVAVTGVWGAGASVQLADLPIEPAMLAFLPPGIVAAGKIEFNKDVDDVLFLNQLINEVKQRYPAVSDNIFVEGVSMGGAMAWRYVFSSGSQADAVAVISGFIGAETNSDKTLDIPVCVFHSVDDKTVPYAGGIFSTPIPDIVADISSRKACSDGVISEIPDIAADNITIRKTSYECTSDYVWFYEISGAEHTDMLISNYSTGPNDMDYIEESLMFFSNFRRF